MILKGNGIMNSTYKMFAVNEKIILYILFLIVLQFFYIFPTSLYIDFYRFVSPCDRWQSAYFDYIPFGLRVKMCVWLGVSRGLDLAFLNAD